MISYLQASGEQGYRANMKAKAKAKIEDRTTYSHIKTRKEMKVIRGRAYFVSRGITGGSSLHPGIWAKSEASISCVCRTWLNSGTIKLTDGQAALCAAVPIRQAPLWP